ncbi:hypothetical protein ABG79_00144 [Caloramator mitchellensis]|uniref:DUF4363 domain-containing protein n=1 Tax=Caloramator mitchellensis TaxID=908809 RepID=A0A0R3JWP9_CALMK|nr:DUF4363 family protein [Caloramator mitchellensis]KRQ87979.1 hypothetical protein ABG79_00144 [Caloramator mitchellensis]
MKSGKFVLIFNIIVFILIISVSLIEINLIKNDTRILGENINNIKTSISKGDWPNAFSSINKLNEEWEKSKHRWSLFINHKEIDNISISLKETIQFIKNKDKSSSEASLATLEHYIKHIYQIERLSLENII